MATIEKNVQGNAAEALQAVASTPTAAPEGEKKKRVSKGPRKPKAKKPTIAMPAGKWQSADAVFAAGFNASVHAKPKEADFADPAEYAKFDIRFYEQRLAAAKAYHDELLQLGSTPEERNAAKEEMRIRKMLENMLQRRIATGGASAKDRAASWLGDLFEKVSNQPVAEVQESTPADAQKTE